MRKLLLASVAILALTAASPTLAQNKTGGAAVGGTAGAVTGGTIGFFLGGPLGAIIGGFAGAAIGAGAGVSAETVAFSANNPVATVNFHPGASSSGATPSKECWAVVAWRPSISLNISKQTASSA